MVNESEAETGRGVEQSGGMGRDVAAHGHDAAAGSECQNRERGAGQTAPAQRRRKVLWE